MSVCVSLAVQAHPDRGDLARALAASLPGAEIIWDPDPLSGIRNPWRTYRAALEGTPAEATHRVVLQDDVRVAKNLVPTLDLIAAARPDSLISLFVANRPMPTVHALWRSCNAGERYATIPSRPWVPAVGLLWPVRLIEPLLAYVDTKHWPPTFGADDEIIGRFMSHNFEEVIATVPSLVEHPDVVESLLGQRRNKAGRDLSRVAACFLDEDLDPLDYDWS